MLERKVGLGFSLAIAVLVTGCQDTSTFLRSQSLDGNRSLVTSADLRTINRTTTKDSAIQGRVDPAFITCAEPSPDVAKAVASSFGAGGALSGNLPSGASPQVAAAITRARAESAAQLGERLATIQLLRDGLYRACEAYANGAITETTYAVIVSRFDETMVTMLSTDIAGGAFGRSLAALGSEAAGKSSATAEVEDRQKQRREAERTFEQKRSESRLIKQSLDETRREKLDTSSDLKTARSENSEIRGNLQEASASGSSTPEQIQALTDSLEQSDKRVEELEESLKRTSEEEEKLDDQLTEVTKEVNEAEEEFISKLNAQAESEARATFQAAGGITRTQDPEVARALGVIHKQFLDDTNLDALLVGCIAAMDRGENTTRLGEVCSDLFSDVSLLQLIEASKSE